jgi:hypothetical protein
VFLRALNSDTSSLVAGSVAASGLFFSPDGKQIGFTRESKIWRAPVSGGAPFEVGPVASGGGAGTAWAEDGYIYSSGRLGLSRVLASGGTRESLTTVDAASGELAHRFPSPVPGRDAIVFTVFKGSLDEARVGILDLRTREWRVLLDRPGHYPRVTRSGRLFFVHRGALLAVRFDTRTLTVTGEPEALLNGVLFATGAEAAYDVSQTGALVYVSESDTGVLTTPTWIARERRATVPEDPLPPEGSYSELAVSPDGLQLALVEGGASPGTRRAVGGAGIAIWDLVRGAFRARLASDGLRASPVWDAGSRNVFFMNRSGGIGSAGAIYRQRADGSDSATPIFADPIAQPSGSSGRAPASLSSDGSKLFYHFTGPPSPGSQNQTIEVFDLTQSRSQKLIAPGTDPQISPDGRWLAYSAPGANGFEVYVRPYPDVDRERWTVSVGGGHWPRWSRDGRELFYESGGRILSVAIDTSKDFSASQPQPVFESVQPLIYYAVHPDGRRLLALPVTKSARPVARVILNCCQSSRN